MTAPRVFAIWGKVVSSNTLPAAEKAELLQRELGLARTGTVDIRSFDEGVVQTLGATIINDNYYLQVQGVSPPPGLPGIPVTFAFPEDVFEKYFVPAIIVRRDDISADMARWHPGARQYAAPALGSIELEAQTPAGVKKGFNKIETLPQAEPVDIMYTISIVAKHRTGISARRELNAVFQAVLSVYQAYPVVVVADSVGDKRLYQAFREGVSILDDLPEVAGRMVGFAITIRVSAELDLVRPTVTGEPGSLTGIVTKMPTVTTVVKK